MTDLFKATIETLTACIGLSKPDPDKEIISLKIDEQECHITEHPTGYLLMFSSLGTLEENSSVNLLNMSMFNQEPKAPVIGYDQENNHVILWSRQSLNEVNRENSYQQLELITQFYDAIEKEKSEASQRPSVNTAPKSTVQSPKSTKSPSSPPSQRPVFPRF